jgi:hypothetical protein
MASTTVFAGKQTGAAAAISDAKRAFGSLWCVSTTGSERMATVAMTPSMA